MDIGKDVLTKTIIGTTDAEKVFTPWWITLHHYLVYTLVVLGKTFKPTLCDIALKIKSIRILHILILFTTGLIAVPLNSMLSVNGNCSYDPSHHQNYIYPNRICKVDVDQSIVKIERRHCTPRVR